MTYGRAENIATLDTLQKAHEYSQDTYFICSDDDKQLPKYQELYGDRVLVFSKEKMLDYIDTGNNFGTNKGILYARNICFVFAEMMGYRYFLEFDDDYTSFSQRIFSPGDILKETPNIGFLDRIFMQYLTFLKSVTSVRTVTMSQGGDYIGGSANIRVIKCYQRKVMNSFFCDVQRPFLFDGAINEDVNYYTQSGRLGILNFNLFGHKLKQQITQKNAGGMTDQYKESGTYIKSFYSVIFSPSCVKVGTMAGWSRSPVTGEVTGYLRIHHLVKSDNAYVKILDEKYRTQTPSELNRDDW